MTNTGKRAMNRAKKNKDITEAALVIIAEDGVASLTMHEVADRVGCAVGTIYTYFSSKSSLLVALQADALESLTESYSAAKKLWSKDLGKLDYGEATDRVVSLARVISMARLFIEWPEIRARDFALLQNFLILQGSEIDPVDLEPILPSVLMFVFDISQLVEDAAESGAIVKSEDDPGDDTLARTLRWAGALDGAVLIVGGADPVESVNPEAFGLKQMATRLTTDFLSAWGADASEIDLALSAVGDLESAKTLFPVHS